MGLAEDLRILQNLCNERKAVSAQLIAIDTEWHELYEALVANHGDGIAVVIEAAIQEGQNDVATAV